MYNIIIIFILLFIIGKLYNVLLVFKPTKGLYIYYEVKSLNNRYDVFNTHLKQKCIWNIYKKSSDYDSTSRPY